MKKIIYLLLPLVFVACKSNEYSSIKQMFEDKPKYGLQAEKKIDVEGGFDMCVFGDYLVVLWGDRDKFFHSVYDMNTNERIKDFAYRGGGPDEYITIWLMGKVNDSVMYSKSINGKHGLYYYNINHLEKDKPFLPFASVNLWENLEVDGVKSTFNDVFLTEDSVLVGRSGSGAREDKMFYMFDVKTRENAYFIDYPTDEGDKSLNLGMKTYVFQGPTDFNRKENILASGLFYADYLGFYKVKDNKITTMKEYNFSRMNAVKMGNQYAYSSKNTREYAYSLRWGGDKLYYLYEGGYTIKENDRVKREESDRLYYEGYEKIYKCLFVFSKKGDPLYSLYLDVNPVGLYIDGDKLYVMAWKADGGRNFYRYDISKFSKK